jgi:hypothetical protein
MALDARVEVEKLRKMYQDDPRQQSFNLLLIGEKGTGKTKILQTARKPVHVDSFDPGGTLVLKQEIKKGLIVPDTRWENEDPYKPRVYSEWKKVFDERRQNKYFDSFGTYCVDSSTSWAQSIMAFLLGKVSQAGEAPKWNRDYKPQRTLIENHLRQMLELPCDFILTGHIGPVYEGKIIDGEEVQVVVGYRFVSTGQGTIIIPLMFSELWVTTTKDTSKGPEYGVLTSRKGLYLASTRIGDGKFDQIEKPDICGLLKKAGWQWKNKEIF